MNETLLGSDAKLRFLDRTPENVRSVCDCIKNVLANIIQDESAKNALLEFVSNRRLPGLASYLFYESGHEQGRSEHQDVDSVFCTAFVFIKDSTKGRLHVRGYDLPEHFDTGDVLLMDSRVHHWVNFSARDVGR